MTDRYVNPAVGASGTGDSWAQAYKTLAEAVTAAAADETIYFANGTADTIAVDTTYTLATGVSIISTSDTTNSPPTTYATGATVTGGSTSGVEVKITGIGTVYGVAFIASNTGSATGVTLCQTDNAALTLFDCTFSVPNASTTSLIAFGSTSGRINSSVRTNNCTFLFGRTASNIAVNTDWVSDGDSFAVSGSAPTILLTNSGYVYTSNYTFINGANLSTISGTIFAGHCDTPGRVVISNSLLHASVTPLGSTTNAASNEITLLDCSYMDSTTLTGKLFYHENHLGSTTISTSIYNNTSGAIIDASTKVSWVIDGKAASSFSVPYISPWISVYNATLTSHTPRFEVLRDGSTTAYTDRQVWAEWEYRATANSPKFSLDVSDKCGPLTTAANQATSSLTTSDWTGDTTAWFGKLEPSAAITAAEVGYMRGRICVAGDITVYVDPKIHGLT